MAMLTTFTHPSTLNSDSYRRPYLNFKEKLTQILLNPITVFLLLFIIKLLFFLNSLVNSLEAAKSQTHLLYDSVGKYASELVSFPHYISQASNMMVAKSVDAANKGLVKSLQLMITASEELILFIIELTVGTYACLLTAAIDDTVIVALNATEDVLSIANDTLKSFARDLNSGLADLTSIINDVIDTAEDTGDALEHMFGGGHKKNSSQLRIDEKLDHVNLTIKNMQDWEIPGNINNKIDNLKGKILNFTDVQKLTNDVIDKPFSELKRQVGTHLNKTFDASTMFVPEKTQLDFSNGTHKIDKLYIDLIDVAQTTTHIIMGIIVLAMILFLLYELYIELKDWRRVMDASQHLNFTNESFINQTSKRKYNVEVIKIMQDRQSNFISTILTEKILRLRNPALINNIRWFVSYSASPFLFKFLMIGILGLFSVLCQFLILKFISHIDVASRGNDLFHHTQTQVYTAFNNSMNQWTNETNNYIANYQDDVNDNLFAWVDTAAMTINNTVSEFDAEMNEALDRIFKGTPLYTPIEQIVGCVIESKLKKIEAAMTWLADNAHLEMPDLDPKMIMAKMAEIRAGDANDSINDNVTKFKDKAKQLLEEVVHFYKHQTMILLYLSLGIIGVWLIFTAVGLIILLLRERKIRQREMSTKDDSSSDTNPFKSDPSLEKKAETFSLSSLSDRFDINSFKTLLYREESSSSFPRISRIMQNLRDNYLKTRHNYAPTPVESVPRLEKYVNENYDCFTNGNERHSDDLFELFDNEKEKENPKEENDGSTWNDETTVKNNEKTAHQTIDSNLESNKRNTQEGTLSMLGENLNSVDMAKRWSP